MEIDLILDDNKMGAIKLPQIFISPRANIVEQTGRKLVNLTKTRMDQTWNRHKQKNKILSEKQP